ncbi:hypothetical protein RP20_CCG021456 [Aedes albopictus]|nr:hypothetical protein RP20_CCG021456 [Aedes albopictus]
MDSTVMNDQQLYDGTMLDIDPILEDFPMEMYQGSLGGYEGTRTVMAPVDGMLPNEDQCMMSPQYGDFIDPDMFLNGVVKRESESDCSTGSHRNTPSPSDSSKSCDSYPSSGYGSCGSAQLNNILFDSPPTSPEYPTNPPQIVTVPQVSGIVRIGAAQLPEIQKPACPVNLADLKKVKIPPKNAKGNNGTVTRTITKKTIVLTAKDYQALMKNMKNQPSNGTVFIRATPASAFVAAAVNKDKPVLPRPLQQSPTTTIPSLQSAQSKRPPEEPIRFSPIHSPAIPTQMPSLLMPPSIEGTVNERALKKHQRMIKNRESAFLSRVRKKEYVTTLEQRVDELVKENRYLKEENAKLVEKIKQKCSCDGSKFKFVNMNGITKQLTPNVRKNTAIVLAMLFMVSFNLGPLGNLLTGQAANRELLETPDEVTHHKRNLLWMEDSNLLAARNVDISLNLSNFDDLAARATGEEPFSICPFYVNQTENIRLASELRRWIGENGYKNLTDRDGDDMRINSFSEMFALKDTIDSMYQQMKDISSQMESFQRRTKLQLGNKGKRKKARALDVYQKQKPKKESDLALYYTGFGKKYAKFFEEIGRRDDTFYLVSFSGEHLLLPALAYNKTNRPKMSLMLPAMVDNATHPSDKVTLMQIDCEVMNTSMIQIREKTIPGDLLRPHGKPDETTNGSNGENTKKPSMKSATEFADNNVHNISSSNPARDSRRPVVHHKHPSARPFFVQRMSEHLKSDYDLH